MTRGQDPFSVSVARQWVASARLNTHTHTDPVLSPCTDLLALVSGSLVHNVSSHPAVNSLLPVRLFEPANMRSSIDSNPFLLLSFYNSLTNFPSKTIHSMTTKLAKNGFETKPQESADMLLVLITWKRRIQPPVNHLTVFFVVVFFYIVQNYSINNRSLMFSAQCSIQEQAAVWEEGQRDE